MPIQFDKFDQQKIDRLKSHLEAMASKGKPKFYEIYVDSLKAVQKTDEPSEFDGYEDYMTPDTYQIKVVIYCSGASPRNDQYVFSMKAKSNEEALDLGLNGVALRSFSTKELQELKERRNQKSADLIEIQKLQNEITELNAELDEKEAYIEKLETGIESAKANGNKIGGVHIGDIVSVALEGLVRRNTHLIAQVPALEGLAGLLDKDNSKPALQLSQPDTEVTVKKKEPQEVAPLSEQEQAFLGLFRELQKHFNQNEMNEVIDILDLLSKDKTQLLPVKELLQEQQD